MIVLAQLAFFAFDLATLAGVAILAIFLALGGREYWSLRILMGSLLALALVLAMPEQFFINGYTDLGLWLLLALGIIVVAPQRLYEVVDNAEGFSWRTVAFAFLVVWLLVVILLAFVPEEATTGIVSARLRTLCIEYFFWWVLAPLAWAVFASR